MDEKETAAHVHKEGLRTDGNWEGEVQWWALSLHSIPGVLA